MRPRMTTHHILYFHRKYLDRPPRSVGGDAIAFSRACVLSGRSLPGAVDYFRVAGLAIDQQDLELLVIALREKDVATHRKVVAHLGRRQCKRAHLFVRLLVGPALPPPRAANQSLTAANRPAHGRAVSGSMDAEEKVAASRNDRTDDRADSGADRAFEDPAQCGALHCAFKLVGAAGLARRFAGRQWRDPVSVFV